MMELYKEHGTNPLSGCLPMLVQIPFMWWLYYAIRTYQYQFNGSFLWVGSSFAIQHAGTWATPKGPIIAVSLGQMDIPLLILYAVSMFFSSKFMPMTSADPEQIKQSQRMSVTMSAMMPFMFYMYGWPSAFILWWLAMNVTQILVTVLYLRHHPDLQALYQHAHPAPAVPGAVPTIKAPPAGSTITKSGISPRSGGTSTAPNGDSSTSEEGASPSTNGAGPRRIEPRTRRKSRSRRF
jgi:YidC/Oxa1 family membrane protein insertase